MFLFCSKPNRPGPPPLNTPHPYGPIETPEERKARHLAMLRRIGELGMDLLENVAMEARAEVLEQAAAKPERASRAPRRDTRRNFALISRSVRDTIALEATIAAGKIPAAPREPPTNNQPSTRNPTAHDPRRAPISEYLHDAIEDSTLPKPTRATLHDQVEPLIEHHLENDPAQEQLGGEIAIEICQTLGIPYKTARMQTELLVHPAQSISETHRQRRNPGPDPPQP